MRSGSGRRPLIVGTSLFVLAAAYILLSSIDTRGPLPSAAQRQAGPVPFSCNPLTAPCLRVVNSFVRADVSPFGSFTMGTTQGDPDTALDDDKFLLYGYVAGGGSDVGSSYTTIHMEGSQGVEDFVPRDPRDVVSQVQKGDAEVQTVWQTSGAYSLRVTETLRLEQNPFSARSDVVEAHWNIANEGQSAVDVGVRSLLDVKIGNNDGAPYFVPGLGTVTRETAFTGTAVPAYWLAFEDPAYDPSRLRSVGLLDTEGVTRPDVFTIAYWPRIQREPWRYPVDVTRPVTSDSAVALLWEPVRLAPNGRREISTRYGIAANRGGRAFVVAPVTARCTTSMLVSLFVSNFDVVPLTNGTATLELPAGMTVATGESATRGLPDILPGDTTSVAWRVTIGGTATGVRNIKVRASFDGGIRYDTEEVVNVTCDQPTATPAPTKVPPTPGPAPTQTPSPGACNIVYGRVPVAVINAALANPEQVFGWEMLANPNLPPSPVNPPRRRLSLRTISKPYSAEGNPLIYKVGCP